MCNRPSQLTTSLVALALAVAGALGTAVRAAPAPEAAAAPRTPLARTTKAGGKQRPLIFHHATVQQAWKSAVTQKRPLIVMFTSDHCRYCDKMLAETYGHPTIQRMLAAHCETVVAHAKTDRELTKTMGIRAFPTSLVIAPTGKVVGAVEGFVEPKKFAERVAPLLVAHAKPRTAAAPVRGAEESR